MMTSKRVPVAARLRRTVEQAASFLAEENTRWFPIEPISIIKRHGWRLKTYTWMAASQGFTDPYEVKQVIRHEFDSEDAIVCEDESGHYLIAYNENMEPPSRINFTLMHEVGHILLGHLEDFPCGRMARAGLTNREYQVLEDEADCFARNVLTPPILAMQLKPLLSQNKCQKIFDISQKAWRTRIAFLADDRERTTAQSLEAQKNQYRGFITSKVCLKCGSKTMPLRKGAYCPFCGSQALYWRNDTMKYEDVYELDETGRPTECPVCKNDDLDGGEFCKICGSYFINKCTNEGDDAFGNNSCGCPADGNARYCIHCGATTKYYDAGWLDSWDGKKDEKQAVLGFVGVADEDLPF